MGLNDLVQSLISGVVSDLAGDFEGNCTVKQWVAQDGFGADEFADAIIVRALVDLTQSQRYTTTGKLVLVLATLTILDRVPSATATTPSQPRENPFDTRDVILLPDGRTAPIVQIKSFLNPSTGVGFIQEVMIGKVLS